MRNGGKNAPVEYIDFQLCRLYGCLPSELDKEDAGVISLHLEFLKIETNERNWKAAVKESNDIMDGSK